MSPVRLALLLGLVCHAPLAAQLDWRPEHAGNWKYQYFRALAEPAITPAEKQSVLAQLRAAGDAFKAMPLLQPPRGVEILAKERIDIGCPHDDRLCRYKPLPAWTEIDVMGYYVDAGKLVYKNIEPPGFVIAINDPTMVTHGHEVNFERLYDDHGNEIVTGLAELEPLNGAKVYDNNVVIIARTDRPLFTPVSQEQYIRALMKQNQGIPVVLDLLRKELAALSTAERKQPAYTGAAETISHLVAKTDEGATPMVIFNPNYFDPALPRTAVQLVTVRYIYNNRPEEKPDPATYGPDGIRTYEIRQQMDYNKLRKLVAR